MLNFLGVYAAVMLLHAWMRRREFRRHPEKAARYEALPLGYKLACRFAVMPLLAAGVFHEAWPVVGLVFFFVLESACLRWYRKAGLY
ncbi:MAG: hypothetical protein AB1437_19205 [Pseudomonadota bacterium]